MEDGISREREQSRDEGPSTVAAVRAESSLRASDRFLYHGRRHAWAQQCSVAPPKAANTSSHSKFLGLRRS